MLLFILFSIPNFFANFNFNTSHVTVYPMHLRIASSDIAISIHLMLLFIINRKDYLRKKTNFNTSHVTVYRLEMSMYKFSYIFQYISCYCLSKCVSCDRHFLLISIHLMLLFINHSGVLVVLVIAFQYISCYCLSSCLSSSFMSVCNFNTSHVTVYLHRPDIRKSVCIISIHLMLLFIHVRHKCLQSLTYFNTSHVTVYRPAVVVSNNKNKFQYISCYCLS